MDAMHGFSPSTPATNRGVTLIEFAIAAAVLAIVAATAVPSLAAFLDARRLDGAAAQLAADVQLARSEAAARNRVVALSLRRDASASCWIVHTGAPDGCRCVVDAGAVCEAGSVAIASTTLGERDRLRVEGNVPTIRFDPLHGTATPAGTLRVLDGRGRSVQHVVNVAGRLRSCSPGASANGWPAC